MTQIEQIKAEIERLLNSFPKPHGEVLPIDQNAYNLLGDLKLFIEFLPAEQPSEDLKKEIDRYFKDDKWFSTPLGDIARHFANWQKEQMMKSAIKIDAKIVNDEMSGCVVDCEQGCLVLEPHTYPIGQQLKILIIKEDKQ